MNYWIMKSEPGEYSFDDLLRDGETQWDGVRNFQARNNMKAMCKGDQVFIYHSISDKALVGLARVSQEHYPDPVDNEKGQWVLVKIQPERKLKRLITLAELKAHPTLSEIPLVKQSRLSVIPISKQSFDALLALEKTPTDSLDG